MGFGGFGGLGSVDGRGVDAGKLLLIEWKENCV
jgi:hypothetical protein